LNLNSFANPQLKTVPVTAVGKNADDQQWVFAAIYLPKKRRNRILAWIRSSRFVIDGLRSRWPFT